VVLLPAPVPLSLPGLAPPVDGVALELELELELELDPESEGILALALLHRPNSSVDR
jgi:hypothetical protein